MDQFQIGKFDIDASRCRISSSDCEVIVEPKVMDVLKYLFSRKGEVASQQQIFDAVWPGATFNPSSVQRCIALLRKALQEDSKNPHLVITHPKRGYSLELPVVEKSVAAYDADNDMEKTGSNSTLPLSKVSLKWTVTAALSVCVAVMLMLIFSELTRSNHTIKTEFSRLLPISSHEDNESYLSVSPDGKHLAFVRGQERQRHIWMKEVASGKETQLTSNASNYNVMGWSPNGSAIAFMHFNQTLQHSVMEYISLDSLSLTPIKRTEVHHFPGLHVNGHLLQWSRDNKIYFVEWNKETSDTWLSFVDMQSGEKYRVRQSQGQEWLITFALAPNHQQIVLGYEIGQNRYRIDLLDLNSNEISSIATIEDSIMGISWHPTENAILVSNRNRLQLIDMTGEVSEIAFDNFQFIRDAQYLPSGKEIFMELRNVDVDIFRKTRRAPEQTETLIDTSSLDFFPVFSPDDQRFVFESHRAGLKQLYVYEDGEQRLIFANPNNEELFGTVWSPDGETVFAASKDKIFKINVAKGSFLEMPHSHGPFYLREHFKQDNAILVSYRAEDGFIFHPAKLDLATMELSTYTSSGQRLACYSMALDAQDNIYFANSKEVFRLNEILESESLWRSNGPDISGLRVKGDTISLMLDEDKYFQLKHINLTTGETEVIHKGIQDGTMLTNASNDEQQFLYLTKPNRTSKLVRLR